jgi:predicted metal-dependent peptidase
MDAMKLKKAEERVVKGRVALLFDSPFFATLMFRLKMKAVAWHPTAGVDGKTMIYNPDFIDELSDLEMKGVLAHEVLHCVFDHPTTKGNRTNAEWQKACDYSINPLLISSGFVLPKDCLNDSRFEGMNVFQIYDILTAERMEREEEEKKNQPEEDEDQDQDESEKEGDQGSSGKKTQREKGKPRKGGNGSKGKKGGDQDGSEDGPPLDDAEEDSDEANEGDGGNRTDRKKKGAEDGGEAQREDGDEEGDEGQGQETDDPGRCGGVMEALNEEGNPLSESEKNEIENEWKVATSQAAMAAKSAGNLPGNLRRMVEEVTNPKVDWATLLRRFMDQFAKTDYTWSVPNRRHIANGDYFPSCQSKEMRPVVVAVDTSGSINEKMLNEAGAHISDICKDLGCDVHVVYADYKFQGTELFTPADLPLVFHPKGGGGTSFLPPFQWIEKEQIDCSCLIYITDLCGYQFPEAEPIYPVLWLRTGFGYTTPPFGEVVVI